MSSRISVVAAFIAAINRHSTSEIRELMSGNHTFIDSGGAVRSGLENMSSAWEAYFSMFPDYTIQVEHILSNKDIVAIFGSASGTYRGRRGLVPENRIAMPAAWRAVVENGKIRLWQVYADWTAASQIIAADRRTPDRSRSVEDTD